MRAQPAASHFIDGGYFEDDRGTPFDSVFAATGETIAKLHAATPGVVDRAMISAARAQGEWASWTPAARARVLRKAADLMRERNEALSELETLDTSKAIQETLVADAASGADAGPHYQFSEDPVTPSVDPSYANPMNEIWLDVTTDANGAGEATATVPWVFPDDRRAESVVLHEKPTATHAGHAGTAGGRPGCVTVDF